MIEFIGQDSPAFDEVMKVLKRYSDFEYIQMDDDSILSVPGLEIYPSRRKIYRERKEISLTVWSAREGQQRFDSHAHPGAGNAFGQYILRPLRRAAGGHPLHGQL